MKYNAVTLSSLTLLSLLGLSAACGQTSSMVDCGAGETRLIGNDRYCVYAQALIIEGFDCPAQMSYHEVPGGAVCSPHGQSVPLPDVLKEPFEPQVNMPMCQTPPCDVTPGPDAGPELDLSGDMGVEGVAPDMMRASPTSPTRSQDATLFGQPLPASPTMFSRVARSKTMACVLSSDDVASCWGIWQKGDRSGLLMSVPGDGMLGVAEVQEVALGLDRACLQSATRGVDCWRFDDDAQGLWVLAEQQLPDISQLSMHHQGGRLGTVCGLTTAGELRCEAMTQDSGVLDALGRMAFLNMTSFKRFSVEQVQTTRGAYFACGITTQDEVVCAETQRASSQRVTQDEHLYADVFVGERGGQTVVTARRSDGQLDVWKGRLVFESLQSPPGVFEELYSAFCGLQDEQVICWDDVAQEGKEGEPTVEVLYPEHPRHMDMALDVSDEGTHWCAISLTGELSCSAFSL